MIRDNDISWIRKRQYFNGFKLASLATNAFNEGGSNNYALNELLTVNPAVVNPTDPEIRLHRLTSRAITGVYNTTFSFFHSGRIRFPVDLDLSYQMGFRANWTQEANTTDGSIIGLNVGVDYPDESIGIASSNVGFAKSFAKGSGFENLWTDRIIFPPVQFPLLQEHLDRGAMLKIGVIFINDPAIVNSTLLGLEMDYVPRRCAGSGSDIESPLDVSL